MNCDRVQLLLNGYIDGELDLVTSLEIEEHLRACKACSLELETLVSLHAATSQPALYHPAPASLKKNIRAAIRKGNPTSPLGSILSWRWLAPAAVLTALVFLFLLALSRGLFMTNHETILAQEIQIAHVRSLMADHLLDVVSSDQHTVKPWFNGKLDFSPPVTDLTAQGFPLAGGRLDYLDGHPAAVLVYQRNKHEINVFIWPSQEQNTNLQSSTDNGYHAFHWNQSGMTFWAISDLNADELLAFIQDLQKSVP